MTQNEFADFDRYKASNREKGLSFDSQAFTLQIETFVACGEGYRPPRRNIMIDISEFPHIDKTGLRVLLTTRRQLRSAGGELVLSNIHPRVKETMDLIGITSQLHIAER